MSAEQLQTCLDRIAAGETVESVLRASDLDAETRALVKLALATGEVLPLRAPSAMRARQQAALQARLGAQMGQAAGRRKPGALLGAWRRVFVRVAGAALAASLAFGSAVVVSADSLPGDALYGVKRAAESARVAFTVSPSARVRLRAGLAGERLEELRALVDRGVMPSPEDIERLLDAHAALQRAAGEAGDEPLLAEAARRGDELADGLRSLAAQIAEGEPATAARLAEAAARVAPTPPRAAQDEQPPAEDPGKDGGDDDQDGGSSAPQEDAPAVAPTRAVASATAGAGAQGATALATSVGTATGVVATATSTMAASQTPRPVASATQKSGAAAPPTDAPPATSAPPTTVPQPTAAPQPTTVPQPTSVPPTSAPPDPTAPIPNPRGTARAATSFPTNSP